MRPARELRGYIDIALSEPQTNTSTYSSDSVFFTPSVFDLLILDSAPQLDRSFSPTPKQAASRAA